LTRFKIQFPLAKSVPEINIILVPKPEHPGSQAILVPKLQLGNEAGPVNLLVQSPIAPVVTRRSSQMKSGPERGTEFPRLADGTEFAVQPSAVLLLGA
jgi:hypothetical protein